MVGNIDQAQYCERIKGIIELLGSKLSLDELSKIWRIQVRPSNNDTRLSFSWPLFTGMFAAIATCLYLYVSDLFNSFPAVLILFVGFSGGSVVNCDRKHPHNHRCGCRQVQL